MWLKKFRVSLDWTKKSSDQTEMNSNWSWSRSFIIDLIAQNTYRVPGCDFGLYLGSPERKFGLLPWELGLRGNAGARECGLGCVGMRVFRRLIGLVGARNQLRIPWRIPRAFLRMLNPRARVRVVSSFQMLECVLRAPEKSERTVTYDDSDARILSRALETWQRLKSEFVYKYKKFWAKLQLIQHI